jgi:hypothetical protein
MLMMTPEAKAERAVYAIAIGNNQPAASDGALRLLRYADDDAVRFHELFSRFARRSELLTVLDTATQTRYPKLAEQARLPSLAQLRAVLQSYRAELTNDIQRGAKPVLYVTFSGHGTTSNSGEYALTFLDGGLTQRVLYDEILSQFEDVQVHLMIDACHAAGVVGVKGPFDREVEAATAQLDDAQRDGILKQRTLARFPNVGAVVAASSTEESHEWSRIESGVFTHEVLSGLYGAADVNGDYRIEYSELSAFVSAANRGLPAGAAKPNVISIAPAANQRVALLDLLELRHTILLAGIPRGLGHFFVETSNGQRILDAHFEQGQHILLALPDSYASLFLRDANREVKLPRLAQVNIEQLTFSPLSTQGRGSVDGALREGLFSNAFGSDYYRGFVDNQSLVAVDFGPRRALPLSEGQPTHSVSAQAGPVSAPRPAFDKRAARARAPTWPAYGLAITSGVALAASGVLGVVALGARHRFNQTEKQRQAHEYADDYATYGNASLAAAALGVGAGIGALLLWPEATVVPVSPVGNKGFGFTFRHAF